MIPVGAPMPSAACSACAVPARSGGMVRVSICIADRCCRANVAACSGCTSARTSNPGDSPVTVQRTTDATAAAHVSPAGPSLSTRARPRANRKISATIPSAINRPITVSEMPWLRQNSGPKP